MMMYRLYKGCDSLVGEQKLPVFVNEAADVFSPSKVTFSSSTCRVQIVQRQVHSLQPFHQRDGER